MIIIMREAQPSNTSERLRYEVMDARNLHGCGEESFEVVLDKGTLDAMYCSDSAVVDVEAAHREAHRVLTGADLPRLGTGAVPPGTYCQTPRCHLVKRLRPRGLPD